MRRLLLLLIGTVALSCDSAPLPDLHIRGEEVDYKADGIALKGYIAYDGDQLGPRPGVLVVHEWWGHNEFARQRARMLAALGYTALALDLYGSGRIAEHPDDAQRFVEEAMNNPEAIGQRFAAAHNLLTAHSTTDSSQTAAIGFCFGGGVVLHMARYGFPLAGVASFHGNLSTSTPAQPGAVVARILVLHGEEDALVPADQVAAFKEEMAAANADMKLISYAGAKHSFTNPEATAIGEEYGLPLAYDESADQRSWAELERFLGELFAGPGSPENGS